MPLLVAPPDQMLTTLGEFRVRYCAARLDLSAGWAEQLRLAVVLCDRWHGRPVRLAELSSELLTEFLRYLLQHGRSGATVNSKRSALLALWRAAAGQDLAPPVGPVTKLRQTPAAPEAWSPAEFTRLVAQCRSEQGEVSGIPRAFWMTSLLLVIYDTGARIGAMLGVRPIDVDLGAGYLRLRASMQKTGIELIRPLHPQTIDACRAIWSPDRLRMWPWPYRRETLYHWLRRVCAGAGVRAGRGCGGLFNKLRRTSGSLVECNGGDGSRHLGNSRRVFEAHYLDVRILGRGQLDKLPRPV